jgi:drug/metabolite transporter (DMT)-like permease
VSHARRQLLADGGLLLVTLIWGSTFVMVKDATANFPVFSFLALRFAIAGAALGGIFLVRERAGVFGAGDPTLAFRWPRPRGAACAALIGFALFAGYGFQTAGLHLTTPAKAGFITGLSVVLVPLFAAVVLGQRPTPAAIAGVIFAAAGLGLLTLQSGLVVAPGDLLVLCGAVSFAAHILLTGRFAHTLDPLRLTIGQIAVVALLSGAAALLFEHPISLPLPVAAAALFTGLLATAFAFGMQTVAQRFTTSTHTALIFAAEPVFAALFSWLLIAERLGPRQIAGCFLILAGVGLAELRLPMRRAHVSPAD